MGDVLIRSVTKLANNGIGNTLRLLLAVISIAIIIIAIYGCTSLHSVKPEDELLARAKVLHVMLVSDEEYVLKESRVNGDSLVAMAWKKKDPNRVPNFWHKEEIRFHLRTIQSMQAEIFDGTKTLIVITANVIVWGFLTYFALQFGNGYN